MILGIWITQEIEKGGGVHREKFSEMQEIITPGGRRTRLREIAEFSTKLLEAPAEIGRVYTSDEKGLFFPKKKNRVIV